MSDAAPEAAGKKDGCAGLMGLGVMLFGGLFLALGIAAVVGELRRSAWDEVPCVLERFEILDDPEEDEPFSAEVEYRYDFGDRTFTGTRLRWGDDRVAQYEDLAGLREELRVAGSTTCRVDPDAPDQSVLTVSGGGLGVGLVMSMIGAAIAAAGFFLWRSTRSRKAAAVTERRGGIGEKTWLPWFFGIFALAGLGMLFGFALPMARDVIDMRGWVEVPAESLWSRLRAVESDDGTTYRPDVFYRYEFDGREYRSNRWDAAGGSSSGSIKKREIVKAHRKGTEFRCFVDPDRPWRAVVHREPGWGALFIAFPLPFLGVGIYGLAFCWKKARPVVVPGQRRRSRSLAKRWVKFLSLLAFAVVWNAITELLVSQEGDAPKLFVAVFRFFGLLGAAGAAYLLVAVFSPRYELDAPVVGRIGQRLRVSWRRVGGLGRVRRLRVWLVGVEEGLVKSGGESSMSREVFFEKRAIEATAAPQLEEGWAEVEVPDEGVPSFDGERVRIRWFWVLRAEVPWRPGAKEEIEMEVTG